MSFRDSAEPLRAAGYSVIPLVSGQKYPIPKQWPRFCAVLPSEQDYMEWYNNHKGANIGVCLGRASKIIAVDFDYDEDGLHDEIKKLLPDSPVKKVGAKGVTYFYRFNGEKTEQFSRNGKVVFEILSQGRQTVLPPSIHPDTGKPYSYIGAPLSSYEYHLLPMIDVGIINHIRSKYFTVVRHVPRKDFISKDDPIDVVECLQYIPAGGSRDEWLQIMFAIKDELGDAGFSIFDRWSQTSDKYDSKTIRTVWDSARGQGVTVGTLLHYSYLYGRPKPEPKVEELTHILAGGNLTSDTPSAFPAHLLDAPGLVGQISRYIDSTAMYPLPDLALAASIAFCGALYGQRIRSETDARTNIYMVGLSPSGSGKDHARQVIARILAAADWGEMLIGEAASGAGLLKGIEDAKCVALGLWDEFGHILKHMTGANAPSHIREVSEIMTKMFSSANSHYLGKQYANRDAKNPRVDLNQPCFSLYATTVPTRFFEALTSSEVLDGFLPRMLIIESQYYAIEPLLGKQKEVPESLIKKIQQIKNMPTSGIGSINFTPEPSTIAFEDEARTLYYEFNKSCRIKAKDGSRYAAIYNRAPEHAIKLALVAHEGVTISERVMRWGIEMSTHCCSQLIKAVHDRLSDNAVEADVNKMFQVFATSACKWFNRTDLIKKSQWLTAQRRNEILSHLVDAERIKVRESEGLGRKALEYGYFPEAGKVMEIEF